MRFRPAPPGRMRSIVGGRLTPAVMWILIVEVGLFLVYAFSGGDDAAKAQWLAAHAALSGDALRAGRAWTIVTSLLCHLDPRTLISAGIGLWLFGTPLEHQWGSARLVKFAVGTALAGNGLAAVAALAGVHGALTGMAGAAFALLVAWGVRFGATRVMLLGAVLPARHLAFASAAIVALGNLVGGPGLETAQLAGGGVTAYLLTTGRGPGEWIDEMRRRLRRRKLHAVPGGKVWNRQTAPSP